MKGRKTCIVLGAGASRDYNKSGISFPLQKSFFDEILSYKSGPTPPILFSQNLHPFLLYVINKFDTKPLNDEDMSILNKFGFYRNIDEIHEKLKNVGIEEMYNIIVNDYSLDEFKKEEVIDSLNEVLFLSLGMNCSMIRNKRDMCCDYHLKLVEYLEPGDFIVSFNYDCLIDDALMYECKYWYPMSGYDIDFDYYYGGATPGKEIKFKSDIFLYHPHGSLIFKYSEELKSKSNGIYLCLLGLINGIQPIGLNRMSLPIEDKNYTLKTLIVPPDSRKDKFKIYLESQIIKIQRRLIDVLDLIFIGYSFPENDNHVKNMFNCENNRNIENIYVVNPSSSNNEFKLRTENILLKKNMIYRQLTFKEFISQI